VAKKIFWSGLIEVQMLLRILPGHKVFCHKKVIYLNLEWFRTRSNANAHTTRPQKHSNQIFLQLAWFKTWSLKILFIVWSLISEGFWLLPV
jgi:hypothetical protein